MREPNQAGKADTNTIHNSGGDRRCARLADEKHAEGTRETYRRAVRGFDEWLDGRPETDAELARHLDHMFSRGLSPNYAGVVVAAVEDRAEREDAPSPCGELTARSLAGFRRNGAGRGTGQVAGIGWTDAKRMAKLAGARGDLAGLRDALYIRIASACLLLRRWLKAAGIDGGPLFRRIHRSGAVGHDRLGARSFRDIVKRRAAAAGIGGRVSGHSFRIGAAQSMRAAGATHAEIMVEGRWKRIETMLRYIRDQDAATGTTARLCFGVAPPDGRSKRRGGHEAAERARRKKRGGKAAKELRRIRKDSRRIMSTLAKQGKHLARIEKAL